MGESPRQGRTSGRVFQESNEYRSMEALTQVKSRVTMSWKFVEFLSDVRLCVKVSVI